MEKNNKPVLIGLVIVLAVAVVYLLATRGSVREENGEFVNQAANNTPSEEMTPSTTSSTTSPVPNGMQAQVPAELTPDQMAELKVGAEDHSPKELTFTVTAGSFYFTPNEIRVKQGDKVKIVFNNVLGTHNLILDAFKVETKTIKGGESDAVEFTADKKGTFEFYCGVGNGYHRQKGQIGVLLVE